MALKFRTKAKEEIPAELQGLYVERDGAWVLDVTGVVEKEKHDDFRAKNIEVTNQLAKLQKRFEGIDPDEVRKLAEEKRRLEEAQQIKDGEVEKVIQSRVKQARGEVEKQLNAAVVERDSLNARLVSIQIDQGVVSAATKRGLRASAIPDITARARSVFRLVDGAPRAFESDGKTVRVGKDGATAMTLEEWIETQVSEAPHLFESNAGGGSATGQYGGGATGNGSGGVGGNRSVRNPFRKDTWNLTEQMKLQKTDPQLAARLKAAA